MGGTARPLVFHTFRLYSGKLGCPIPFNPLPFVYQQMILLRIHELIQKMFTSGIELTTVLKC
jgi:hypothetical protein